MKLDVALNEQDIEHGERCSARLCPVACALRRLVPQYASTISVGAVYATVDGISYVTLPEQVQHWLTLFDWDMEVKPIRFTLEFPPQGD